MIDVLIITYNEAVNLPHCLRSLQGWTRKMFVIDSGSTDGTQQIARNAGAELVEHEWPGYAAQRNWGLTNLPLEADWILILDADEEITLRLRDQIVGISSQPVGEVRENGFFINRLTYFLSRPIKHCGYFPSWNLRLFKRGVARYEDRQVHEHVIIDDPVGYVHEPMLHNDRRGLEHFYAKHNRYSTLEAREIYREISGLRDDLDAANLTPETRRRRWLKRNVTRVVPFPSLWRFLYMYVFRLGVLDGWTGYRFCLFIANYDAMVAFKLRTLLHEARRTGHSPTDVLAHDVVQRRSALAKAEGGEASSPHLLLSATELRNSNGPAAARATQMQPESSPWSFKAKVARALWMIVGKPLFRLSFHNWYGYRRTLLRLFGARIGSRVAIRPSVNIEIPWMLDVRDDATVGDYAILYSLGRITIGQRTIISQYAHLCAGTHDYTDHTFKLQRTPINLGDDAWIGADAFVGPGVNVGSLAVLGARSSAYRDLPESQVCVGNPAKPIKPRILR